MACPYQYLGFVHAHCGTDRAAYIRHTITLEVTLEKMVPHKQMAMTGRANKVLELRSPAISDFDIIRVDVETNRNPVFDVQAFFGRQKLTAVNQHALATCANGRDAPNF